MLMNNKQQGDNQYQTSQVYNTEQGLFYQHKMYTKIKNTLFSRRHHKWETWINLPIGSMDLIATDLWYQMSYPLKRSRCWSQQYSIHHISDFSPDKPGNILAQAYTTASLGIRLARHGFGIHPAWKPNQKTAVSLVCKRYFIAAQSLQAYLVGYGPKHRNRLQRTAWYYVDKRVCFSIWNDTILCLSFELIEKRDHLAITWKSK